MKTAASYIQKKYDCYKGYSEESIREVCHMWCEVIEEAQNDVKKEYEEKLRWIPVEEKLPPEGNSMETTDLRTEFTKETKTRFNTEWLAYNDYVDWLEQRLVKLLTIPPVINCPNCGSNNTTSSGIKPYKHYCRECTEHWN